MKKLSTLIYLFLFLTFATFVHGESVKNLEVQIAINQDGSINVEEKIQYDFENLKRHGIYRKIPVYKINQKGKKFWLKFTNFSVVDEKNNSYPFAKKENDDFINLKIGDPYKTISGIHTYVIRYKVAGALTYFSDHDELYWNAVGNQWEVPINKAMVEVILPQTIKEEEIRSKCYTGRYFSKEESCEIFQANNKIVFKTKKVLNSHEGFTIVVGFPPNRVAKLEPIDFWRILKRIILILLIIFWYLLLPFYIVYKWIRYGRDPKGNVGVVTNWYDPPKTIGGKRFLTPAEVGVLIDERADLKDIAATLVDLARRGYLRIEEKEKNNFFLVKNDFNSENDHLLDYEKTLLEGIFHKRKRVELKKANLTEAVEKTMKKIYSQVTGDGLFEKNPESIRRRYFILAFFAAFTLNLPLVLACLIFGRSMPRKTPSGVNAKNIALSLKNFLSSQERQFAFQADKQLMFEKLLPYAIVFGIEKIWAKRFKDLGLRQPNWYQTDVSRPFDSYLFVNSLNSSITNFYTAATKTSDSNLSSNISSSGFSSGFSGGFSGGGGGGGGGGSW